MRVIEYDVTVEGQEVPEMFCLVTDLMDCRELRAEVAAARVRLALPSSTRPAPVRATLRVVRTNKGESSSRSSERIEVDSADRVM